MNTNMVLNLKNYVKNNLNTKTIIIYVTYIDTSYSFKCNIIKIKIFCVKIILWLFSSKTIKNTLVICNVSLLKVEGIKIKKKYWINKNNY